MYEFDLEVYYCLMHIRFLMDIEVSDVINELNLSPLPD